MIAYRLAQLSDWDLLLPFYKKAYRKHHPLQDFDFWKWQYGNEQFGSALIGIADGEVVAHLGLLFYEDYICSLNLFIDERFRNGEVFLSLLDIANQFRKQHIGVAVGQQALPVFRLQQWYQYANLERRLIIHPEFQSRNAEELTASFPFEKNTTTPTGYFWQQPGLKSIVLEDGSTAITQNNVGGLRFVTIENTKRATAQAFEMGYRWCDFITSYNNPKLIKLERNHWKTENEIDIPWLLNPVVHGNKSNLTFISKEPIARDFYINRMHADLGRIGSINR